MSNDQLRRTGRGVPVRQEPKPKKWFGIKPEFVIAAAVVIAVAMMVVGTLVYNGIESARPPADAPSGDSLPAETQIECVNIKHAYAVWDKGRTDLETLQLFPPDMAGFKAKGLFEDGKTFLDAVSGHADQPSKHLATTVAGYNVEVGFVNLAFQIADKYDPEAHQKAIDAWRAVDTAYKEFLARTCGG